MESWWHRRGKSTMTTLGAHTRRHACRPQLYELPEFSPDHPRDPEYRATGATNRRAVALAATASLRAYYRSVRVLVYARNRISYSFRAERSFPRPRFFRRSAVLSRAPTIEFASSETVSAVFPTLDPRIDRVFVVGFDSPTEKATLGPYRAVARTTTRNTPIPSARVNADTSPRPSRLRNRRFLGGVVRAEPNESPLVPVFRAPEKKKRALTDTRSRRCAPDFDIDSPSGHSIFLRRLCSCITLRSGVTYSRHGGLYYSIERMRLVFGNDRRAPTFLRNSNDRVEKRFERDAQPGDRGVTCQSSVIIILPLVRTESRWRPRTSRWFRPFVPRFETTLGLAKLIRSDR